MYNDAYASRVYVELCPVRFNAILITLEYRIYIYTRSPLSQLVCIMRIVAR